MSAERPYTLVAELTHRCGLRCLYCSNPVELSSVGGELSTDSWRRVFREASALGIVQVHLTGGEPLLREDLEALCEAARDESLYVSLITSGVPLTRERLVDLHAAGVDALQLSIQGVDAASSRFAAGQDFTERKLEVARWVRELGIPFTLNAVLHRENLDQTAAIVALAERLGADRLELANTQFLGWALANRAVLLPSREQVEAARTVALAARARLAGKMEVVFVFPDYVRGRPRACMNGWGRRFVVVAPDGRALPCHLAATIRSLTFPSVEEASLETIWSESAAFEAFRGEDWMPEPCRSCDERGRDFGGCRCQAYHLTGDPAATDPACALSPEHHRVSGVVAVPGTELHYRRLPVVTG